MNSTNTANEAQKKLFFALANELEYDTEVLKERAKELYKLEHFNNISSEQISALIDKLQHQRHATEDKPKVEHPIVYKFGVYVVASSFRPIAKIFDEINEGMASMMGEDVKIDADVQMGTISCRAKEKLTNEQLNEMAKILQTDFQERFKMAVINIKPL